ncbi:hypothetical protein SAMN05216559_3348 [Halomicrobium zhouii]|uniref:Uncharacterized protein n=1 Tax=Halomicrobium zhouii TaxID=767519 RepID=A0A1I6LXF3_9EURY|nr:DUF5820 family protein [Halomicrobium zhouii]SFS08078.1 hypothetical protein SAMN05216559_3348 [Halomicrobium zhouii]
MSFDSLADDWVVWSDEGEKAVLAFRPDVFDGDEFPAPCLPTIYLTRGQRDRRPGSRRVGADWYVTLALEPEITREADAYEDREGAVAGAVALAEAFATGEIDYRDLYQVPRPDYFERLDELTGRGN